MFRSHLITIALQDIKSRDISHYVSKVYSAKGVGARKCLMVNDLCMSIKKQKECEGINPRTLLKFRFSLGD